MERPKIRLIKTDGTDLGVHYVTILLWDSSNEISQVVAEFNNGIIALNKTHKQGVYLSNHENVEGILINSQNSEMRKKLNTL